MEATVPATVLVTFRPEEGHTDALAALVVRAGVALERLGLLTPDPHLTFRTADPGGKPVLIEILTWKDPAVSGNPPEEVRTLWSEMQKLVEARAGRPGIEVQHLTPIGSTQS